MPVLKQGNNHLIPLSVNNRDEGTNIFPFIKCLAQGNQLDGYTFVEKEWGSFYYKVYGTMKYLEAVERCRADGGGLPVPLSV